MAVSSRAVQVADPGGTFAVVRTEIGEPGPGEARIAVEACGMCHSDASIIDGYVPGSTFPLVPGHEIAGRIEAVGEGVVRFRVGDRVAAGYIAGTCGHCVACVAGDRGNCTEARTPGVSYPGGFADRVLLPADALSRIPDQLSSSDAAALACAGLTAFDALRNSPARPGDVVAVLGLGGVGHLAVQMAARTGFETVAVSRGPEKREPARELGANHYIDATTEDVGEALRRLGGAKVVVSTVTDAATVTSAVRGLGRRGELVLVGMPTEDIRLNAGQLNMGTNSIRAVIPGTPLQREETFDFAVRSHFRPLTEVVPLESVSEAYWKMRRGEARFRMVLTTGN